MICEHWWRRIVQVEPEWLVQGGRGQGGGKAWGEDIPCVLEVVLVGHRHWWVNCKLQER